MPGLEGVRILLAGVGNLGRRFAGLIAERAFQLEREFGLGLVLVGAAGSRGPKTALIQDP